MIPREEPSFLLRFVALAPWSRHDGCAHHVQRTRPRFIGPAQLTGRRYHLGGDPSVAAPPTNTCARPPTPPPTPRTPTRQGVGGGADAASPPGGGASHTERLWRRADTSITLGGAQWVQGKVY